MDKNKIAVVGDPSSVMIFKAVGFDVFYEQEPDQIKRRLHTLADEGYVVIYITEMAASLAADVIDEYATATFPAIIPIPAGSKSLGLGMKRVKENVEKAVEIIKQMSLSDSSVKSRRMGHRIAALIMVGVVAVGICLSIIL